MNMGFKLSFGFEYRGKLYASYIEYENSSSPLPQQGDIVIFGGWERELLASNRIPYATWFVALVAHDYADGRLIAVTVSLEHKSERGTGSKRLTMAPPPNHATPDIETPDAEM